MKYLITLLIVLITSTVIAQPYLQHRRKAFRPAPSALGPDWTSTNAWVHYKANSITGSDGDAVDTWTDSSGSGNTGYRWRLPANSIAPYFTNNVCGGYPAIHFIGSITNAITNTAAVDVPFTIFMVMRYIAGSDMNVMDSISSVRCQWTIASADNKTSYFLSGALSSPDASPSGWNVYTVFAYNLSNTYFRTNGTLWFQGNAGTPGGTVPGQTLGGRYQLNAALRFNGEIAEYVLYKGTMADADRNWVEASLKSKYGL